MAIRPVVPNPLSRFLTNPPVPPADRRTNSGGPADGWWARLSFRAKRPSSAPSESGASSRMLGSLLILGALTQAMAQGPSPGLLSFLQQQIGLDANQMAAASRGDVVVKVLDSPEQRDIALFGIVGIKESRQAYAEKQRDFPTSLRTPTRTRFGIFHDPGVPEDVAAFMVTEQDMKELKDCKPGNCVV